MTTGGRSIEEFFLGLIDLPSENEWVEFKEAKRNFSFNELGQYFSALSNEANLAGRASAWLVFGVTNKWPRAVVNTAYRPSVADRESLKQEIALQTSGNISFIAIHELLRPEGRVLLFEIPPAPRGHPVAWKGHFYGRNGESLVALSLEEIERIRRQYAADDWSAETCGELTVGDLAPEALAYARKQYAEKNPRVATEVRGWDDATFLNKAKIAKAGLLSKAAVLLLGKPESIRALAPVVPRLTWVLRDKDGIELDYHHFEPPLILSVQELFARVRNLTYRYLPDENLFPVEVSRYDAWVIRETLFNAIAHQDYRQGGQVSFVEGDDSLLIANSGEFIPGSIANVVSSDSPPDFYRNPWLAQAMVSLNMIDTIGSGIKRVLIRQKDRFFPMPDYDLDDPGKVKVRIFGRIIDENYTKLLISRPDLGLLDAIALDKVQKKRPLSQDEFVRLKELGLVEGRRAKPFLASSVAAAIGQKAAYIRNRAFDDAHYRALILSFLAEYGETKRDDVEKLIAEKLPDILTPSQKKRRVGNLLQDLREASLIYADGKTKAAVWRLTTKGEGEARRSQS